MMDYFIGKGIDDFLTGIERAQMNRLGLFKKMGRPAKILRFTHKSTAHTDAARFGVTDADICNMFDWYQHAEHVATRVVTPKMVCPSGAAVQLVGREGEIVALNCFVAGKLAAQIRYHEPTNAVRFVLWSDENGKLKQTDTYDTRGFVTIRSIFEAGGKAHRDEYLTPAGEVALTIVHRGDVKETIREITLADGRRLADGETLKTEFLQALDRLEPSRFFFDRAYSQSMVTDLPLNGLKFIMVHNNVRTYAKVMQHNRVTILREMGVTVKDKQPKQKIMHILDAPGNADGIIVPTPQEAADLQADYPRLPPMYIAPAGISVTQPARSDFASRNSKELIVVARISPEKGIGDSVAVALQLHKLFPDIHMSIYGGVSGTLATAYVKRLNQQILKAGAVDAITFMGFREKLDDIYNHAGMMIVTSGTEAFPTAIQEALSHGLPVISYDVDYGPADMITDGENGRLVPADDKDAMVEVIDTLLRHPDQLEMLSNGAYRLRKKYGARAVWAQYQQLPESK